MSLLISKKSVNNFRDFFRMLPNKSFEYVREKRGPDAQKRRAAQFIRYAAIFNPIDIPYKVYT